MSYPPEGPELPAAWFPHTLDVPFPPLRAPRKFQSRLWLHMLLLLMAFATTTLAGADHYLAFISDFARAPLPGNVWFLLVRGLWYSLSILGILGAHEMGHYVACRYYNIDASLPYFIPVYIPLPIGPQTGTFGAVIRIREPFPNRKVLFDIGAAGPIAGFVVLVAVLFCGLALSSVVREPSDSNGLVFLGEPLLFKLATRLVFGSIADGWTLNMHPMVFAAWFGMLATALNLLPFGQLDGGHITYAALRRWSTPISVGTVSSALLMTIVSPSWWVITALMIVMLFMFGPRHPRVLNEEEPLDRGRQIVAVIALAILILCFIPIPVGKL